jgi:hypothetical protein
VRFNLAAENKLFNTLFPLFTYRRFSRQHFPQMFFSYLPSPQIPQKKEGTSAPSFSLFSYSLPSRVAQPDVDAAFDAAVFI